MTEFNGATIPIRGLQTSKVDAKKVDASAKPAHEKPLRRKIPRLSVIAFLLASMSLIGWGTWRFMHSSDVDNGESIADLDGFESVEEDSLKSPPNPVKAAAAATTGTMALPDLPTGMFSKNEPANSPEVWLTGTIEEAEQTQRNALPKRLSGGPNDSSTLR